MSRYDKYDPVAGGFRAPLEANFGYTSGAPDFVHAELGKMKSISLNGNGRVVIGAANVNLLLGVMILTEPKAAGEIADVMTFGEIVEFTLTGGGAAAAGTFYYGAADGTYGTVAPAIGVNGFRIGWTVEAGRLIVRSQIMQGV